MIQAYYRSLSLAVLLLTTAILASCNRPSSGDVVLDYFHNAPVPLSPETEIDLESAGILMPSAVRPYHSSLVIEKGQASNMVDIYTPSSGEIIHCFKKGRGPKEILTQSSFQVIEDSLFLYDISRQKYYSLDLASTITSGSEVIEEVDVFGTSNDASTFAIPFVLYRQNGIFYSTGIFANESWFIGITEEKGIVDGPDYISYDVFSDFSQEALSTFHTSSTFAMNPSGSRLLCASVHSPAFTICETRKGSIVEKLRYVADREPLVKAPDRHEGGAVIVFAPNHLDGYVDACADDDRIYLLYSGKPAMGETPVFVSSHLLVYDWDGKPISRIELEQEVQSIHLSSGKLYCTTSYPEAKVLIYDVSQVL